MPFWLTRAFKKCGETLKRFARICHQSTEEFLVSGRRQTHVLDLAYEAAEPEPNLTAGKWAGPPHGSAFATADKSMVRPRGVRE